MAFVDQLAELCRAGARVLWIVTEEEERAIALCRAAFGGAGAPAVAVWSRTRGLDPIDPGAKDGRAALDALFLAGDERPTVALLLDFHHELEDRGVARRLRDLLPSFYRQRRCAVVVAPRLAVPEGLAAEVTVLRLPLPGRDELAQLLSAMQP